MVKVKGVKGIAIATFSGHPPSNHEVVSGSAITSREGKEI
jgi:hypothetical protein